MPFTVHEEAMRKQMYVNVMRPQETVAADLPKEFSGTLNQGLPVKEIPHMEYPKCIYMHPNKPTKVIEHRSADHELLGTRNRSDRAPDETRQQSGRAYASVERWLGETHYIASPLPKPDELDGYPASSPASTTSTTCTYYHHHHHHHHHHHPLFFFFFLCCRKSGESQRIRSTVDPRY